MSVHGYISLQSIQGVSHPMATREWDQRFVTLQAYASGQWTVELLWLLFDCFVSKSFSVIYLYSFHWSRYFGVKELNGKAITVERKS